VHVCPDILSWRSILLTETRVRGNYAADRGGGIFMDSPILSVMFTMVSNGTVFIQNNEAGIVPLFELHVTHFADVAYPIKFVL
jgi:predicted outer membrane repeat protein